jgi:hypothetical protein
MEALTASVLDLFFDWLHHETGHEYRLTNDGGQLQASDDARGIALSIATLFQRDTDPEWSRRCEAVARQLGELTDFPLTLWVPPEADLPHGDRSEFLRRVADAAAALQPGQRGQAEFPVNLTLKKTGTEDSYVHVIGGLAPHWARLTGRAYGQYVLDTTPIHRLPEPPSRVADLIEWVALLGNGMKPGSSSDIKAEDAWTVRRSIHPHSAVLIGAPPHDDPTNGTSVRRQLREALKAAAGRQAEPSEARALILVGDFRTMDEENATIALRSSDPAFISHLDLICLEADGKCKALYGPRAGRL